MLVLWLTRSPVDAGWMAFAATAPSLLVYVPAGALVDLWRPRMVMLISECGRGAAIATVAAAVLFHRASLPLLIVAAVVEETLEVFSTLAERRYLSWLVGHEDPARRPPVHHHAGVAICCGRSFFCHFCDQPGCHQNHAG